MNLVIAFSYRFEPLIRVVSCEWNSLFLFLSFTLILNKLHCKNSCKVRFFHQYVSYVDFVILRYFNFPGTYVLNRRSYIIISLSMLILY